MAIRPESDPAGDLECLGTPPGGGPFMKGSLDMFRMSGVDAELSLRGAEPSEVMAG